jgi:hypothetical protein
MSSDPTRRVNTKTLVTESAAGSSADSEGHDTTTACRNASSEAATSAFAPFINCLVTPKLTFSLQRKPHWLVPTDIPQSELREAFLQRFPVRFGAEKLAFKCATPTIDLASQDRLVFRINSTNPGGDDERVLLQILSSLDRAYSAKFEAQLEAARADLLSSSMSFQVVADEVRATQQACAKKWEREVRSLKEQMSTNQKRLFLLEREKEGLQRTCAVGDEAAGRLRLSVSGLSQENEALRERTRELEEQVASLREFVASHMGNHGVSLPGATPPVSSTTPCSEVACQTGGASVESNAAMWQQQHRMTLQAMGEWLRTGAALLNGSALGDSPMSAGAAGEGGAAQPPRLVDAEGEAEEALKGAEPSSIC